MNLGDLLDLPALAPPPAEWPRKQWAPVARDRVGDIGAVLRLQRSSQRGFYSDTLVFVRRADRWAEEWGNGDLWPQPPDEPRPGDGRPIAMLTGTSGSAVGDPRTHIAFTAGVVTTDVARLRVTSAIEEHELHVDERTGSFVALTVHEPDATMFRIAAFGPSGQEIDCIEYRDPWS